MIWFEEGKIKTTLCDMNFIERVWRLWADLSGEEVDALWGKITIQEISDDWLKAEGLLVCSKCPGFEPIKLVKVDIKTWIIENLSEDTMREFVDQFMAEE